MHKQTYLTRIDYDTYPSHRSNDQPLTEKSKAEHQAIKRAFHLSALFFCLSHIGLTIDNADVTETEIHLRELGDLGQLITGGLFNEIDIMSNEGGNNESTIS